jgi:S1-C subfamily serine protease
MTGHLVGLNTAIFSRSGGSQGIGFAIPANMVRVVVASAKSGGSAVKRPWLGAKLQEVTAEIAEGLSLKRPSGALVAAVTDASPADRAGLKAGDVIVSVDGQPVDDPHAFDYRFATQPLGGSAKLGIVRGGKDSVVSIALETAPDLPRDELVIAGRSPFQGLKVSNISPALADELHLDNAGKGVVVLDVTDGSPGQMFGFQPGDVIEAVNDKEIARTRDLEQAATARTRQWRVTMMRGGQRRTVTVSG